MKFEEFSESRTAPHSLTLEQSVIGGLMGEPESWDVVSDLITEKDFYSKAHQYIFRAIKALNVASRAIDALIVSDWLKTHQLLDAIGGEQYLGLILNNCPTSAANIRAHVERVREFAIQRQLLGAAEYIQDSILNNRGLSTVDLLNGAETLIMGVSSAKEGLGSAIPVTGSVELLEAVFDEMDKASTRKEGELSGVDTGLTAMNQATDGFQRGDMIVIGARPSMGKTTLAMNFAEQAMFASEYPVVIFSMESPKLQITQRLLSARSRVPMTRIKSGRFEHGEFSRAMVATSAIKARKIVMCDRGSLTTADVRTVLKRVVREYGGISYAMIDYIQKMRSNNPNDKRTRNDILTEISADLKSFAVDFNFPFAVLSQLSKECERRPNKRPMNSDLRDCGGIEQDADIIIMCYRDEVYNPTKTDNKGKAELIITKNRNGPVLTVHADFHGSIFRFEDMRYDDGLRDYDNQ